MDTYEVSYIREQNEKLQKLKLHYEEILKLTVPDYDTNTVMHDSSLRASKALLEMTQGYQLQQTVNIKDAIFDSISNDMVVVKDISIKTLCEHHLLPVYGKCHIGYLPDKKILGLSKFSRICEIFSRRFQLQERLSQQIANYIDEILNPLGIIVVLDLNHMCMQHRGVQENESTTKTIQKLGLYQTDKFLIQEFFNLIKL